MNKLNQILKKLLSNKLYHRVYGYYLILRHPKKELPNYILKKNTLLKMIKKIIFFH